MHDELSMKNTTRRRRKRFVHMARDDLRVDWSFRAKNTRRDRSEYNVSARDVPAPSHLCMHVTCQIKVYDMYAFCVLFKAKLLGCQVYQTRPAIGGCLRSERCKLTMISNLKEEA